MWLEDILCWCQQSTQAAITCKPTYNFKQMAGSSTSPRRLTCPGEMNSLMTLLTTSDAGKKSMRTCQDVSAGVWKKEAIKPVAGSRQAVEPGWGRLAARSQRGSTSAPSSGKTPRMMMMYEIWVFDVLQECGYSRPSPASASLGLWSVPDVERGQTMEGGWGGDNQQGCKGWLTFTTLSTWQLRKAV